MIRKTTRHIVSAHWTSPHEVLVELTRNWRERKMPPLSLRPHPKQFCDLRKVDPRAYARESGFYIDDGHVVFQVCCQDHPHFDWKHTEVFVAGDFNEWEPFRDAGEWKLHPRRGGGVPCHELRIPSVACIGKHDATVRFKFITANNHWLDISSQAPNVIYEDSGISNYKLNPHRSGDHLFNFHVKDGHTLSRHYEVVWKINGVEEAHTITPGPFFRELETDLPLGARVDPSRGRTVFRVFAPRASAVSVVFYPKLKPAVKELRRLELKRHDSLVWEADVKENLHLHYYHLHIDGDNSNPTTHFDPAFPVLDPYAKACVSAAGPGIIIDFSQKPYRRDPAPFQTPPREDLVVMEAHVRDVLRHMDDPELTTEERLGFNGLSKCVGRSACYLQSTGVNALELQPVQQFDTVSPLDYHWGYMTTNFFSPASDYGGTPTAGAVIEFARLVDSLHEAGMAVIVDVVYNHMGNPAHLLFLDKLYFFEIDGDGNHLNWSGCGNTLACNPPMMKRLIIDSLKHFVSYYQVDGFRFDLAELLGIDVMEAIEKELRAIKPDIILIAEPWSFRGNISRDLKHTGIHFWNDGYRDFLPDYVQGKGSRDGIEYFLGGSLNYHCSWPAQSVNYVESHDDFCWIDRITENPGSNGDDPTETDIAHTHLMIALLMMSLGTPMISAGQDMLRSKKGHGNTYQHGELNALDYSRAARFPETVQYFRDWIAFRLSPLGRLLRPREAPAPQYLHYINHERLSSMAAIYNADCSLGPQRLLFATNPHCQPARLSLGRSEQANWRQIADECRFGEGGEITQHMAENGNYITLPPKSCGLWVELGEGDFPDKPAREIISKALADEAATAEMAGGKEPPAGKEPAAADLGGMPKPSAATGDEATPKPAAGWLPRLWSRLRVWLKRIHRDR